MKSVVAREVGRRAFEKGLWSFKGTLRTFSLSLKGMEEKYYPFGDWFFLSVTSFEKHKWPQQKSPASFCGTVLNYSLSQGSIQSASSKLEVSDWLWKPRIIYARFHTKSAVLLCRIKNQNIEAENQKLMVETLGPLQGKQEVFKEGAIIKSAPYWSFCELHLPAGLLELPGRLQHDY